jgi:alkyl sulfatase BDS1-like metallo-beta-lactamase superfamily hydrolase
MRSGFRDVVLGEIFRRLPDFLDPHRARTADLTVGFRLLGHPTGEIERYVVRVAAGAATVTEVSHEDDGEAARRRHATVTLEGHDFLRLATGHLSPITGVLKGQLKVRGDKAKALQLAGLFDIPSAE